MKFVDVINDAIKHNWTKEDLIAYDNASIAEQDERGKITAAEKKAQRHIAWNMKKEGFDRETIKRLTGPSDNDIAELKL